MKNLPDQQLISPKLALEREKARRRVDIGMRELGRETGEIKTLKDLKTANALVDSFEKIHLGEESDDPYAIAFKRLQKKLPNVKLEHFKVEMEKGTKMGLRLRMAMANIDIDVTAEQMMNSNDFELSKQKEDVHLVVLAVGALKIDETFTKDVFAKAEAVGLSLCPAETAPYILLQTPEIVKKFGIIALHVAMETIEINHSNYRFNLNSTGKTLTLGSDVETPGLEWADHVNFVFRLNPHEN